MIRIHTFSSSQALGQAAANKAAPLIQAAIDIQGHTSIILATGASQVEMLNHLTAHKDVQWEKVTMFHLDEYIGINAQHPASFRRYLQSRFVDHVPSLKAHHFIVGDAESLEAECERLSELITQNPVDVALIGIGENGHLAFNDPPADFATVVPYIQVKLDTACKQQQVDEGWFPSLEAVPSHAITMSIQQILKSKHLIVSVPDARKAAAVACCVNGPITPDCPASILQQHPNCDLFVDTHSATHLDKNVR